MKTNLILTLLTLGSLAGKLTAQSEQYSSDPVRPDEFEVVRKPFYLPNKLVQPPVMAWDTRKTLYSVSAEKGATCIYKTGTSLYIPQNAFVDEQGKKLKGDVQIDYREFKDPIDFVFSGIPMTYDSGGSTHTFESAGMFDIAASQNGKQVYLARGKALKMDFVSTDSSTSYNFYVLDDQKGTWVNKGKTDKPLVKKQEMASGALSEAVRYYLRAKGERSTALYHDTTTFSNRFNDTSYYYTSLKNPKTKRFVSEGPDYSYLSNRKIQSKIRLTRLSSGKRGEIAFKFTLALHEFPEMRVFAGKSWVITDAETRSSFRAKFGTKNKFNDVRLEQDGEGYAITLKSDSGFVTLHAYPIAPSQLKKTGHGPANVDKAAMAYHKSLTRREKMFNRGLAKARNQNLKRRKEDVRTEKSCWASANRAMSLPEKRMSFETWKSYCEVQVKKEKETVLSASAGESTIIRSLELDGMGVFNCDQIQRLTNPIVARAKYKDIAGAGLKTTATYIIDNKINGVLRYDGYLGYSPSKIAYSAESDNFLITIREDGKVAYADKESFRAETNRSSKSPDFVMAEVDPAKMSVGEFRKVLGLK